MSARKSLSLNRFSSATPTRVTAPLRIERRLMQCSKNKQARQSATRVKCFIERTVQRHLKRRIEGPMLWKVNGVLVLSLTPAEPVRACRQYSVLLLSVASVSVTKLNRSPNRGGSDSFTFTKMLLWPMTFSTLMTVTTRRRRERSVSNMAARTLQGRAKSEDEFNKNCWSFKSWSFRLKESAIGMET